MNRTAILLAVLSMVLAGCNGEPPSLPFLHPPHTPATSPVGLVPLPCTDTGPLRSAHWRYCDRDRNFVTARARRSLIAVAEGIARGRPGYVLRYMEASWPSGVRPMPPHLSHGDGREVDLALFYVDRAGRPLPRPPTRDGYRAYEPPRREADRVCTGAHTPHDAPDPPAGRSWRLDEAATADLVRRLSADPAVRRIFIEPHLKQSLGFAGDPKVRFAGCAAARHDDHIHVDFW